MVYKTHIIVIFLLSNIIFSQNDIALVNYKIIKIDDNSSGINKYESINDSKILKKVKEITSSLDDVECQLFFDNKTSLFKTKEKLELNDDFNYKMAKVLAGGIRYKNQNTKEKIERRNSLGMTVNIFYSFDEYKWTITNETKKIGEYICRKAISTKTDIDTVKNEEKVFNVEAWFTNEIPVPFGPAGLDGLPGLVLEASPNGKIVFYVDKIIFNYSSDKKLLCRPKGGTNFSEKEYLTLLQKKFLEFKK